jgi:hypothetical protein
MNQASLVDDLLQEMHEGWLPVLSSVPAPLAQVDQFLMMVRITLFLQGAQAAAAETVKVEEQGIAVVLAYHLMGGLEQMVYIVRGVAYPVTALAATARGRALAVCTGQQQERGLLLNEGQD